jgi:transcriptional regulator with XRE-family HTH domain
MKQTNYFENTTLAISPDERAFFVQLGLRIADLRKQHGITQIQLAETLNVSQQTINSYEVARRRVPVSALPTLAILFEVSVDELLGKEDKQTSNKRGPASKLQKQLERVSSLPRSKQKFVIEMIDTVIQQAS